MQIFVFIIFYIKYFLGSMFVDTTKFGYMFTSTQQLCFCRSIFTVLQEIDKCSGWFNTQSDDVKYAYILRHLLNNDIYLVFNDKNILQLSSKEECRKYLEPYILKFDTELKTWKESHK